MNTPNTKRNLKRTKSHNYSIKNSSMISDEKSINLTIREYINKKLSNLKNNDSKSFSKNTTKQSSFCINNYNNNNNNFNKNINHNIIKKNKTIINLNKFFNKPNEYNQLLKENKKLENELNNYKNYSDINNILDLFQPNQFSSLRYSYPKYFKDIFSKIDINN